MVVIEGLLKALFAIVIFNPVGWICVAIAFWCCDYQTSTALSAAFFGTTLTAYTMWSLYGKKEVNVIYLVPVAIVVMSYTGFSVVILNGVFISIGINAAFQLARREQWFKSSPKYSEPRW